MAEFRSTFTGAPREDPVEYLEDLEVWAARSLRDLGDAERERELAKKSAFNVRNWIAQHVSSTLNTILKDLHSEYPDQWYDLLRARLNITDDRLRIEFQNRYSMAMSTMRQAPSDYSQWIEQCVITMTHCRDRGLVAAQSPQQWWQDLTMNTTSVLPHWPQAFASANRAALTTSNIT